MVKASQVGENQQEKKFRHKRPNWEPGKTIKPKCDINNETFVRNSYRKSPSICTVMDRKPKPNLYSAFSNENIERWIVNTQFFLETVPQDTQERNKVWFVMKYFRGDYLDIFLIKSPRGEAAQRAVFGLIQQNLGVCVIGAQNRFASYKKKQEEFQVIRRYLNNLKKLG